MFGWRQWKVTAVLTKPEVTSVCYMKLLFTALLMVRPDESWANNSFKYLLFYQSEIIHEEIANLSIMLAILCSVKANSSAIWHGLKKLILSDKQLSKIAPGQVFWLADLAGPLPVGHTRGSLHCRKIYLSRTSRGYFFGALFMLSRTLF